MTKFTQRYAILFVLLLSASVVWTEADNGFTVVAVQFEVQESLFGGRDPIEVFAAAVESIVEEAVRHDADLIAFPEYINVFLLAADDLALIEPASSLDDAIRLLLERYEVSNVRELLHRRARRLTPEIVEMWQALAAEYEVAIIPGTFFWPKRETGTPARRELTNRVIVLDESGAIAYRQDKVFLTPEEKQIFGLSAGSLEDAKPFEIEGTKIAVTICRDSFFSQWDVRLGTSELWIDLRANGEPYTRAVRERFRGTLAERVALTDANVGLSATLTGSFLELLWEGPSYAVDASGRRVAESPTYDSSSLVIATLDREEGLIEVVVEPLDE
ncbi:MAG: nitrilase-related carbon-nitrogen hydrolase [Spirochaetota bacterium]